MKKLVSLMILAVFIIMVPVVYAEPSLSMELTPEPLYDQLWDNETYLVNIILNDFNLTGIDLTGYAGEPTGFRVICNVYWKGKGGYDFGTATTGYGYNLDDEQITRESIIEEGSFSFNLTAGNDEIGFMKPYESTQILIKIDAYLLLGDEVGPKIASKSHTFDVIDEIKVEYLHGKYSEMEDEINLAVKSPSLETLNREKFQEILDNMNMSLTSGDYIEALDIWSDYNDDDRIELIYAIIKAAETEYTELEELRTVEDELEGTQEELENLQDSYNLLENTYDALANTYSKVNSQLDVAKRNLTTTITAVFLTAIVFYFLGRRGVKREVDLVA